MSKKRSEPSARELGDLVSAAWEARKSAYAPYSNFLVGAAVLTTHERVFSGANIENASYSISLCAERVAAAKALSEGAPDIIAVAVVSSGDEPAPPCGACRQFLFEFNPHMTVVSAGTGGERRKWLLSDLLPDGFGPENLGKTEGPRGDRA